MRSSRPLRSTVTVWLLALLTALGTGLPSHHHGEAINTDHEERLVSADHHAHATQLVEQGDRVPSGGLQIAAPVPATMEPGTAVSVLEDPLPDQLPRPQERAPPPGAPRAPPVRI